MILRSRFSTQNVSRKKLGKKTPQKPTNQTHTDSQPNHLGSFYLEDLAYRKSAMLHVHPTEALTYRSTTSHGNDLPLKEVLPKSGSAPEQFLLEGESQFPRSSFHFTTKIRCRASK